MNNIIRIKDIDAGELEIYNLLNENQLKKYYEPDLGLFIAESPKVIKRALDAGYIPESMLLEERLLEGEIQDILSIVGDIPVYVADEQVLMGITGFKLTRGALCAMRRRALPEIEILCKNARRIVVLEDVENPTNVGAIFRSAAALNIDAIILTGGCSDPLYRRSVRVSMGTVFQIPWTFWDEQADSWLKSGISQLNKFGFKTAAMALSEDSIPIDDAKLMAEEKLAIIMGAEGEGLKDVTIKNSDYVVKIPMSHDVDSLNVAAASAVAFWQLAAR